MLSVGEIPVSDHVIRSGCVGAASGVVSSVKEIAVPPVVFPAVSVIVGTNVCIPSGV